MKLSKEDLEKIIKEQLSGYELVTHNQREYNQTKPEATTPNLETLKQKYFGKKQYDEDLESLRKEFLGEKKQTDNDENKNSENETYIISVKKKGTNVTKRIVISSKEKNIIGEQG